MEKAISSLIADKGFTRVSMAADGNCFFNAVVYLMKHHGVKTSMTALRRNAAAQLQREATKYEPFFTHDTDPKSEYSAATRAIGRSRTWNTQLSDIVIDVVAQLLNISITIYDVADDGTINKYEFPRDGSSTEHHINLVRVDDCHFDALEQ